MNFKDLLRQARSRPVAPIHQFYTNYAPESTRVYGFVEGDPDRVYYSLQIERLGIKRSDIHLYSCEGKKNVYHAYSCITAQFPHCRRTLFFVDKDLDDLAGTQWPTDPRIYVTNHYSIENHLVSSECIRLYLTDHIKIRRCSIAPEPIIEQFERQLSTFHRLMTPIMAWILVHRRRGQTVQLNDINLARLFSLTGSTLARKPNRKVTHLLQKSTQATTQEPSWRWVRAACYELQNVPPKSFVRGKFEVWFFVHFLEWISNELEQVAKESGGSITLNIRITATNFVHQVSGWTPPPENLARFLEFHLTTPAVKPTHRSDDGKESFLRWTKRMLRLM